MTTTLEGQGGPPAVLALDLSLFDRTDQSGGPDTCWPWTGCRDSDGYGNVKRAGKTKKAHRVAYELAVGPIPDGHQVCHQCDNPPCCNPRHLLTGTALDNAHDKVAKGRARGGSRPIEAAPRGEGHGCARLTESQVLEIRRRHRGGETQSSLAREFGVHLSTVHLIVHRKKWSHLR